MSRLRYMWARALEAGPAGVSIKIWQKISPLIYFFCYFPRRLPRTGLAERVQLRRFGALCAQAFLDASSKDASRGERTLRRRDDALNRVHRVLGYGPVGAWTEGSWHSDPLHGYSWPLVYFPFCDFVANNVRSDVKIPWEMNRLQNLVWLAEAAIAASPSERLRLETEFLDVVNSWSESNPAGFGVNWTCGMEVAIRGSNLALAAAVFSIWLDDSATDKVCRLLRAHQRFVARFREVSDVPGNHYLADLLGEVVLHAALDGLESSATSDALIRFAAAADEQFELGGCHIERATGYHRLTVDMVAISLAIARRASHRSVEILERVMGRALSFLAQITDCGGNLPAFGDHDSGFVWWFGEKPLYIDKRLCGAPAAPLTDLYSFLCELAGQSGSFLPQVVRQDGCRSGFATLSASDFRLTIKTGPTGLAGRAPHDHDDALAVVVSYRGKPLIVDPGCHSYTLDPNIRREALLSSRHNAPRPAMRERHFPVRGSINLTMRGVPTAKIVSRNESTVAARIENQNSLGMEIERQVTRHMDSLVIRDQWRFERPEGARLFWLLNSDWVVGQAREKIQGNVIEFGLRCDDMVVKAIITVPDGSNVTTRRDHYFPDYGACVSCSAISILTPPSIEGYAQLEVALR
ncbi:heparinase II/III family protein [Wenzhouxiangella sp. XN24]|uniref:heparinase II/III domain-containing protein n=1 Tax=Wenzhouxiangella sp. XN24 TaxID=2713569 RepID=UPI0013EE175E|nr:heparinase II/III family protein [Wenzhouxiangella sp. XN24]NGX17019.1 hypothetical protein [Wenzhouxiangella sp. XN24]